MEDSFPPHWTPPPPPYWNIIVTAYWQQLVLVVLAINNPLPPTTYLLNFYWDILKNLSELCQDDNIPWPPLFYFKEWERLYCRTRFILQDGCAVFWYMKWGMKVVEVNYVNCSTETCHAWYFLSLLNKGTTPYKQCNYAIPAKFLRFMSTLTIQ